MEEFHPPINSRPTDELIHIANYTELWSSGATIQAKEELKKRGVSEEEQKKRVELWDELEEKALKIELERRKTEGFRLDELVTMTLFWPRTLLWDWYLKKDGYIRMHKQRIWSIVVGMLLYISTLVWANFSYDAHHEKLYNEISNEDIYEWERDYYSEEEFINLRSEEIKNVKQLVNENSLNGKETVVLINQDTLEISRISKLDEIDPLTIRLIKIERVEKLNIPDLINVITL